MAIKQIQFIDLANAPEATDDELYRQFLTERNRADLAVLFRRYIPLIFGISRSHFQDKAEAQEASLSVFDYVYHHAPNAVGLPFRVMLYNVCQGICQHRKEQTSYEWQSPSEEELEKLKTPHPIDVCEDAHAYVKAHAKDLTDMEKKCVEQFYIHRKTYSEIAQQLRIATQTVKLHLRNAKEKIEVA